jgi:hypothetical protein
MVAASYCSSNQLQETLPAFRVDTVARSVILIMSTESVPATVVEDIQEEEETQETVGLKSPHEEPFDEADGSASEQTKVSESNVSASLALYFEGCNMTPALQHEIDTASKLMQEKDLKAFFDFVDRKWKDEVKQVLSGVPKVTEDMRLAWLSESVGYLIRTFIKEGIEDWQPEIMPNELEDVAKRDNAERLLTQARLCNKDDIGKVMSRAVDAAYGALPIYAKKKS